MKPDLGTVTLCAIDCLEPRLAARSLEISASHCKFADSILLSHEPVEGSFRNVRIDRLRSVAEYSAFMVKELNAHVQTPFVLVTQWDGYVTHPAAWTDEFLKYDYIGAVWDWHEEHRVGNGGFSLRSRRLLQALADPQFKVHTKVNEDDIICRAGRPALERTFGIRFAPEAVAHRFAYERSTPAFPTFGFHGLFNFGRVVSDTDLQQIVKQMAPSTLQHSFCAQLAVSYFTAQRWKPLQTLYTAWRSHFSLDQVRPLLALNMEKRMLPPFLQICEALLREARQ